MLQEIYVIDDGIDIEEKLKRIFKEEKEYRITKVAKEDLELALKNIPSLIIVNESNDINETMKICKKIKNNEDNSITPIIIISKNKECIYELEMLKLGVLYYIKQPIYEEYLHYIITNILKLLYVNRRVSPLTGLPGNVQIQAEIKKRILNKEEFCMMYFDLDNFKAYNDVYGFIKGDEIIKFTSKVILKNVHSKELEDSFVGHIGGDDFIAIVSGKNCEDICQNIIAEFDFNVKRYYTAEDSQKGYIQIANRKGIIEEFPITSISIGVVEVENGKFDNVLEIGEAGAAVKHLAKTIQGSTYVIDRRKKH
ncbi:MAG: diguanylate cyclase [Clostridia bacterium]|nr:diguanylate cyclase [Clostridia bacterium]